MFKDKDGFFCGEVPDPEFPFRYQFCLNGDKNLPDPFAPYQPNGVHGVSEISREAFCWTDQNWHGVPTQDLMIYELHIGAFTEKGTFAECSNRLAYLVDLGINAIELLPLAQCPGRWNWGYDGVGLFAVNSNYGSPEDLKRLIDRCHEVGISVIHDVVYNHVGPEGNYLGQFGDYFSKKHGTPWGSAFDFDGPHRERARELVIENALFWLREYHFDGLRLDAIHFMFDDSDYSIQRELCDRVRQFESESERRIHLIGEANIYDHDLIVAEKGGSLQSTYSAIWSDDLMHAIYSVAETGQQLTPRAYHGAVDLQESLQHGYLYSGPVMKRSTTVERLQTHGEKEGQERGYLQSLIMALQTHDSVGNHPAGLRIHQLTSIDFNWQRLR